MAADNKNIVDSIFKRTQKIKNIPTLFFSKQSFRNKLRRSSKKIPPLGIDIGTNSFKIASILPGTEGFVLSDLIVEEFNQAVINDPARKKELLPEILKMTIEKYNLSDQVYASISPALAQIKTINLSPMPKEEIEGALRLELQQTNLKKEEDISFDYIVLNSEESLNKSPTEVLAIVSAKKDILDYMQILTSAGLKPLAIEMDSISAISCLNFMNQINPNEIVVFLELGAGVSTLNIVEDEKLRLVRNVSLNGNLLTSSIKEHLNIKFEEAEEVKKSFDCLTLNNVSDFSGSASPELANVIKSNLDTLILDIEHTFKYYSYQLTRSRVGWFNRLVLSGGCGLLKNIDKYLSDHLDVPVQVADPFRRLNISSGVKSIFPDINIVAPRLSVCVGLALRGQITE